MKMTIQKGMKLVSKTTGGKVVSAQVVSKVRVHPVDGGRLWLLEFADGALDWQIEEDIVKTYVEAK